MFLRIPSMVTEFKFLIPATQSTVDVVAKCALTKLRRPRDPRSLFSVAGTGCL